MNLPSILDDEQGMKGLDPEDMLGLVEKSPSFVEWCLDRFNCDPITRVEPIITTFLSSKTINGIFIAGMGGSAISGDILHDWLRDEIKVPVIVIRDYHLPNYIDSSWLGFILSYSGNTEETLSVYAHAKEKNISCIGITSGGLLGSYMVRAREPILNVPAGFQPRAAFLYMFTSLAIAVIASGLIDREEAIQELASCILVLKKQVKECHPSVSIENNVAKRIAIDIQNTVVLIYGFKEFISVARRLKGQINENGKNPAYYDGFSELNHNETVGWEINDSVAKVFSCIFLRDPTSESNALSVRMEYTKRLLRAKSKIIIELVPSGGNSRLERMLSLVILGDFVSVYLAFLNGKNPTPVAYIQGLKDELTKKVNLQEVISKKLDQLLPKEV